MSRSRNSRRGSRGGKLGYEYWSRRLHPGGSIPGRWTKTQTHRAERRAWQWFGPHNYAIEYDDTMTVEPVQADGNEATQTLADIRARIVANGGAMLTWDDIDAILGRPNDEAENTDRRPDA